ncbi:hypothetical protein GGI35DRAFT_67319 [Trichoderma velutinum]
MYSLLATRAEYIPLHYLVLPPLIIQGLSSTLSIWRSTAVTTSLPKPFLSVLLARMEQPLSQVFLLILLLSYVRH